MLAVLRKLPISLQKSFFLRIDQKNAEIICIIAKLLLSLHSELVFVRCIAEHEADSADPIYAELLRWRGLEGFITY